MIPLTLTDGPEFVFPLCFQVLDFTPKSSWKHFKSGLFLRSDPFDTAKSTPTRMHKLTYNYVLNMRRMWINGETTTRGHKA